MKDHIHSAVRWRELIDRHLLGELTAEEAQELESALTAHREAREDFRLRCNVDAALRREAALIPDGADPGASRELSPDWFPSSLLRPWTTAAAVGVLVGIFLSSVISGFGFDGAASEVNQLILLKNGDFEDGVGKLPGYLPLDLGLWAGDASEVVAGTSKIKPKSGNQMLRFFRAESEVSKPGKPPKRCDVHQLVDLRPLWSQVGQADEVTLELRASFLDAHDQPDESFDFFCRLLVYSESPEMVRESWANSNLDFVASAKGWVKEGDPGRGRWRTAQAKVFLPRSAQLVAVHLSTARTRRSARIGEDFSDCYVDDVSLTVTRRSQLKGDTANTSPSP